MNRELLKKLQLQAGGSHYPDINPEIQAKFAELIVQECCEVLTENVEVALDASGSPVYPEGLICKHFGVEE